MSRKEKDVRDAFTLVEMLVVIGIMALLAAVIGVGLQGGSASAGISSGTRVAASMMQAARTQAVLKQTRARVIINKTSANTEKELRFMGIIYQNPSNNWLAANDGALMPKGVYFYPDISTGGGTNNGPLDDDDVMRINFPRSTAQSATSGEDNWYYYEFDANGLSSNSGARFVLAAGSVVDDNGTIEFMDDSIGGFVIHKLGGISIAQHPDDLQPLPESPEPPEDPQPLEDLPE